MDPFIESNFYLLACEEKGRIKQALIERMKSICINTDLKAYFQPISMFFLPNRVKVLHGLEYDDADMPNEL